MNRLLQLIQQLFKKETRNKSEIKLIERWNAFEKANELFNTKKWQEALPYFDIAISSSIKDAYCDRAFCLQALDYHYDAIEDFNRAIIRFGSDGNLYYGRACSYMALNEYEIAETDLRKAIMLSEVNTNLNYQRNQKAKTIGWESASKLYKSKLSFCLTFISPYKDVPEAKEKMIQKLQIKRR